LVSLEWRTREHGRPERERAMAMFDGPDRNRNIIIVVVVVVVAVIIFHYAGGYLSQII
jgi:hypothetical protein